MLNRPELDAIFRAVAEPTRRDMIEALTQQPLTVSALAQRYDMSLSAVSQHLKVLVDVGIASCNKVGRIKTCRVEPDGIKMIEHWVAERRAAMTQRLDRLEAYLAAERKPPQ